MSKRLRARISTVVVAAWFSFACGSEETPPAYGDGGSGGSGGSANTGGASTDASAGAPSGGSAGASGGGQGGTPTTGGRGGVPGASVDASADAHPEAGPDAAGGSTDSGIVFQPPPDACQSAEQCDGVDNDCDGVVDEGDPGGGAACATGLLGACAAGVLSCVSGSLVCTATAAVIELCNGIDDDCDGTADQDNPEGGGACSTGLLGVCSAGSMTCQGGVLTCVQGAQSTAELCNGLDDDCDGTPDQGNPGSGQGCNTGLAGACASGLTTCSAGSLACSPASAGPEVCNGLDDDCDGTPDQANPQGAQVCSTGLAGACAPGTTSCNAGSLACVPDNGSPELCNGADDDCDGTVDDGDPGGGAPCSAGQPGACAAGTQRCQGGLVQCVSNVPASAEACNGVDDDCDGSVDNGNPGGGAACTTGLPGVCANGTMTCQLGSVSCAPSAAVPETCNDLDDDCDGAVDDGNPEGGAPCSTGAPGPCDAGTLTCQSGSLDCVQTVPPRMERCNGVDDDCDGTPDQGNPEGGVACSTGLIGVCAAGTLACQSGALSCLQNVLPDVETCNGLDDDCEGNVDQGNPGGGAACTTGLPGVCAPGTITCSDGSLQCLPDVPAGTELCNGLDDDCDGTPDQGNPEGGASCSTGLLGVCAAGTVTCQATLLSCVEDVPPDVETCNGLDDDCNGTVDDGPNACGGICVLTNPPGSACDFVGALDLDACDDDTFVCSGLNTTACSEVDTDVDGDGYAPGTYACGGDCDDGSTARGPGATELCDVIDNDCNGFVDEVCACEAIAWDGGGDGTSWTDPLNWSPDVVPGSGPNHCVTIPAGANVTLAGQLGSGLHSLTLDGTLTHPAGNADGVTLLALNLAIGATGAIDASGRGFGELAGPGAGANGTTCACSNGLAGSGAGHGGVGGHGQGGGPAGGASYGNLVAPTMLGSGGGHRNCAGAGAGGFGGGRVRLVVPGTLTLDGSIRADGATSATAAANGGGSGGSVWITAGAVVSNGAPTLSANGGHGTPDSCAGLGAGGGGGGRIAIDGFAGTLPASLSLEARAGTPAGTAGRGGAGTVYWQGESEPFGHLEIDNASTVGALTPLPEATGVVLLDITVLGGASVEISSGDDVSIVDALVVSGAGSALTTHLGQSLATLDVADGATLTAGGPLDVTTATIHGKLTHVAADTDGVTLTATDVIVGPTGSIDASGRGFAELAGPGAGRNGSTCACGNGLSGTGGGYGGIGGPGQGLLPLGGASYGDLIAPLDLGSGGGHRACSGSGAGGSGGGLVRLVVSGTLTLEGAIRADGATSVTASANAGGSGGSVWITAPTLLASGAPTLSANGGNGTTDSCGGVGAGSGAGGRVAIDGFTGTLPPNLALEAHAGTPGGGAGRGAAGTVFWMATDEALGHLRVDNAAANGALTPLPEATAMTLRDLTVLGGASVEISTGDAIDIEDAILVSGAGSALTTDVPLSPVTIDVEIGSRLTTAAPLSATTVTIDGTLSHIAGDSDGVTLTATDVTVGATGSIDVSGRGFGERAGPGAGLNGTVCACGNGLAGSGAGHGAPGGVGQGGAPAGGPLYGSRQGVPMDLGSGGGRRACSGTGTAGLGGGLAHLFVEGTLLLDGSILAHGTTSAANAGNGGGSGGSIWVVATSVVTSGAPVISAGGGNGTGDSCGGVGSGGGAGGRIAIFADVNSLGGALATAPPGTGAGTASPGNPGIVFQFPNADSRVTLVTPGDGAAGDALGTGLSWTGFTLTGTQHFHVEVDDDPHFDASANHPETGAVPVAITNETTGAAGGPLKVASWATPPLMSGKTYYWHVVVHNSGNGVVGGSKAFAFVVP